MKAPASASVLGLDGYIFHFSCHHWKRDLDFGKGPDVGTLVPGTREKNWGWYLVLGMGNKVGTWYSGRKKMGLVPGIRGEIGC